MHEGAGAAMYLPGAQLGAMQSAVASARTPRAAPLMQCDPGVGSSMCSAHHEEAAQGPDPMFFVGDGQGEYIQEMTYTYVGCGAGQFSTNSSPRSSRSGYTRVVAGAIILIVTGATAVVLTMASGTKTTTAVYMAATAAPYATAEATYACSELEAVPSLTDAWPADRKSYCCTNYGVACSRSTTTTQAATTTTLDAASKLVFECMGDEAEWGTWSVAQQVWCCQKSGKACSTLDGLEVLPEGNSSRATHEEDKDDDDFKFDCGAAVADWMAEWSDAKKTWCCKHGGRGCDATAAEQVRKTTIAQDGSTTSPPFDCHAKLKHWRVEWSIAQQTWCCENDRRGCWDTETTKNKPVHFDCDDGFGIWQSHWSPSKQAWCCKTGGRGCPTPVPDVPQYMSMEYKFDCSEGFENWQTLWRMAKRQACCRDEGKGCDGP